MIYLTHWLWPVVSALLATLLLWSLLRQRNERPAMPTSAPSVAERAEAEDMLKVAYALQEEEESLRIDELARGMGLPKALTEQGIEALLAFGWVEKGAQGGIRLTDEGEGHAQDLIRAHRLWERYLVDREGVPLDAVHAEAHRREHDMSPEEVEQLDAELGHPAWDPHGHAIPAPKCRVPSSPGHPLSEEAQPGSRVRIVCVDDEPAPLLAQLVALGLEPGVDVKVVDRQPDLLRLQIDGETIPLAPAAAHHIRVAPAPTLPLELGSLPTGTRARIVEIKGVGKHQRRMLDMGFVPGASVNVIRRAPLGDPVEYTIKGTAVALRKREANTILVEEVDSG